MKILVVTLQAGDAPRTGVQVRSWYAMRLLQQAGQLDAVSLTPPAHVTDTNADLVWQREFSFGVFESAKNPAAQALSLIHIGPLRLKKAGQLELLGCS